MWTTKVLKNSIFNRLTKTQKVNQFPRTIELTRKDFLVRRIQKMQELFGPRVYDFVPKSYVLPKESDLLKAEMEKDPYQHWIIKPA